ncbi:MAG: hypothetical protein LBN29_08355 [Mediterranea sp.]|jgi:hypothetical protein|nr:hypothetical protein [Mediterranea sp.]
MITEKVKKKAGTSVPVKNSASGKKRGSASVKKLSLANVKKRSLENVKERGKSSEKIPELGRLLSELIAGTCYPSARKFAEALSRDRALVGDLLRGGDHLLSFYVQGILELVDYYDCTLHKGPAVDVIVKAMRNGEDLYIGCVRHGEEAPEGFVKVIEPTSL